MFMTLSLLENIAIIRLLAMFGFWCIDLRFLTMSICLRLTSMGRHCGMEK